MPAAVIPKPVIIAKLVIKTPWAYRRNTFYFLPTTPVTGLTELEEGATSMFTALGPLFADLMPEGTYVQRVEARYMSAGGADFESNSTEAALEGDISPLVGGPEDEEAFDVLPDEVSLVVQVRTGSGGRSKRGRRFITALSEQVQTKGEVSPLYIAKCKALADALSEPITEIPAAGGTEWAPRHWDRKNGLLLPITKCYALSTMGTRRDRRKPLVMGERL